MKKKRTPMKKKCEMKIVVIILLVAALSGCATQKKYTQEQWEKYSTRFYEDKTPAQIIEASIKLFTLSDPSDYSFNRFEDYLEANRQQFNLLNVSYDKWTVRTYQKGNTTKVILGFIWMNNNLIQDAGTYQLFWARLDYLLGLSTEWISCDKYSDLVDKNKMKKLGMGLCWGEVIDDNSP